MRNSVRLRKRERKRARRGGRRRHLWIDAVGGDGKPYLYLTGLSYDEADRLAFEKFSSRGGSYRLIYLPTRTTAEASRMLKGGKLKEPDVEVEDAMKRLRHKLPEEYRR